MEASQCLVFQELSSNVAYHLISAVKGTLCLVGTVRVVRMWRKYGVRFLVHNNTKILFRYYFALNLIISTLIAVLHLAELVRLRFDCFLLDFRYILLTRGFSVCSIIAAQHIILVLSLERLYSTIYAKHFERNSSKLIANAIAITVISASYIYGMMRLSNNFRLFYNRNAVALFTVGIQHNQANFELLMRQVALLNLLSLITLLTDIYLNFFRNRGSNLSLAVSYQFSENRRIIRTLLPIELMQLFIILLTLALLIIYGKVVPNPTPIGKQLFLESVTFASYFPLVLTFIIEYSVEKQANRAAPVDPAVDHFELLRRSWNI